jgi:hypothetical protein
MKGRPTGTTGNEAVTYVYVEQLIALASEAWGFNRELTTVKMDDGNLVFTESKMHGMGEDHDPVYESNIMHITFDGTVDGHQEVEA